MKAPVEPNKDDCCNNGCNPCIFDIYEKQLQLYEKLKRNESQPKDFENGISQLEYTSFIVINEFTLSDNIHKIIQFRRQTPSDCPVQWKPGQHFIILYKSNGKKISRAYTPINLKQQNCDELDFSIVVKKYTGGEVSNYLFDLSKGDLTLWRGPYGSYDIISNKYENIILIAQGTGIAPFIEIIENILSNEEDLTRLHLHYCSESKNSILFREDLYAFKNYCNFTYKVYLCQSVVSADLKYQEPIINRRFQEDDIAIFNKPSQNQYLLCGSNQFMLLYKDYLLSKHVLLEDIILF